MKEAKRRRSLSGAVLIMILTVMFVLIILLTATLTTVTTANQRIYTKYEENQAYYTARSALDVFTQNLLDDSSYWAGKTYDYTNKTASPIAVKTGEKMKQGLALQFDLYKIHSQCETYGKDGSGKAVFRFAENMDTTDAANIFSAANMDPSGGLVGTPPEKNNFSIETTTPLNGDTASGKQYDYIEYQVTLPTIGDGSSSYGKFVDLDYNKTGNPQIAKIKVEVLDRIYATDPSYTADQLKRYFTSDPDQTGCPANDTDLMKAIANASRSKDYMKLKITSTVTLLDTEGVAVVIIETTKKDPPANRQALTTSGTAAGRGGSSPGIEGGFSTMTTDTTALISGDEMNGLIYSLGSFKTDSSNCRILLDEGSCFVAMKGLEIPSGSTTIRASDNNRFMFLGGTSNLYGNIGDSTNGISTIAETLKIGNDSAQLNYYGNIYAKKVIVGGIVSSHSVNNGHTFVTDIEVPDGWLWVDGDGKLNISMDGADAFNKLNATLNNGFTIHDASNANIIDSSNIADVIGQNGRTLNYNTATFNVINFSNDPAVGSYTAVVNDERIYRKYANLPFSIDGKTEVEIPTPQAFFKEYYVDGAFNPASGDLGLYNGGSIDYTETDYDTLYDETNNVLHLLKTGAYLLEDYLADEDASYVRKNSIADIIDTAGYPTWSDSMAGTPVDLSGGDQIFELSGTYYNPITVTGSGGEGRLIFLIRENGYAKFDGIGSGFTLFTDYINDSQNSIETGITKAPAIDFYGGTNSKFDFGNQCTISGYIVMPTGDVKIENGSRNMTYDGDSSNNTFLIGSILCRAFDAGNHPKILYLDKDSGADIPGEPHLTVKSSQYVRS